MKPLTTILFLISLQINTFCQDTIAKIHRINVELTTGIHYKDFFVKKYIQPTPYNLNDDFAMHQFDRFTKMPTVGYRGGCLISCRAYRNWSLLTGLMNTLRKDILTCDFDTIIKYNATGNGSYENNIHNIIKYDYSYQNLELPLMIQYTTGRFNFFGGIYFPVLTYCKATYTYLVSSTQYPYFSSTNPTAEKSFKYRTTTPLSVISSQVSYTIEIKRIYFQPFLGIDISLEKSFYAQCGVILPIKSKRKG